MTMENAKKDNQVSERVIEAVKIKAVNGKLSCPMARALAKELNVPAKEGGKAANNLGIKIHSCELDCF